MSFKTHPRKGCRKMRSDQSKQRPFEGCILQRHRESTTHCDADVGSRVQSLDFTDVEIFSGDRDYCMKKTSWTGSQESNERSEKGKELLYGCLYHCRLVSVPFSSVTTGPDRMLMGCPSSLLHLISGIGKPFATQRRLTEESSGESTSELVRCSTNREGTMCVYYVAVVVHHKQKETCNGHSDERQGEYKRKQSDSNCLQKPRTRKKNHRILLFMWFKRDYVSEGTSQHRKGVRKAIYRL